MDARNPVVDSLIGRALIAAEAISSELRERIVDAILDNPHDLTSVRMILSEFEPALAEALTLTDVAAWVVGFETVAKKLPARGIEDLSAINRWGKPPEPPKLWLPSLEPEAEPVIRFPLIEDAATSLFERGVMTRPQFDKLTDQAKTRAFTVAYENSTATLDKIRNVLAENIEEGTSLRGFRQRIRAEVEESRIGPAHLENVYRTNIQSSFMAGHDQMMNNPIVEELFPYIEYLPIHDGRVRDNHLALESLGLNGTGVYRADDPFWDVWMPPNGYQCRCGINALDIEAAARKGVKEAQRWERTGIAPKNPEYRYDKIPFSPEPGFGGRPRRAA